MIPKALVPHVLSGRLRGAGFALYVWLHLQADHKTGRVWTNAARLATELGFHPVAVRRQLEALQRVGYIRYVSTKGSHQLYAITVKTCHDRSEGGEEALHEPLQDELHEALQDELHERGLTPRNFSEFFGPKNKNKDKEIEMNGGNEGKPKYPPGVTRLW